MSLFVKDGKQRERREVSKWESEWPEWEDDEEKEEKSERNSEPEEDGRKEEARADERIPMMPGDWDSGGVKTESRMTSEGLHKEKAPKDPPVSRLFAPFPLHPRQATAEQEKLVKYFQQQRGLLGKIDRKEVSKVIGLATPSTVIDSDDLEILLVPRPNIPLASSLSSLLTPNMDPSQYVFANLPGQRLSETFEGIEMEEEMRLDQMRALQASSTVIAAAESRSATLKKWKLKNCTV